MYENSTTESGKGRRSSARLKRPRLVLVLSLLGSFAMFCVVVAYGVPALHDAFVTSVMQWRHYGAAQTDPAGRAAFNATFNVLAVGGGMICGVMTALFLGAMVGVAYGELLLRRYLRMHCQ